LSLTQELAEFSAGIDLRQLSEEVRARARLCILDGIGVMLGAVEFARRDADQCLERYLELAAPPGAATVVGSRRTTTPMMAAFANGVLSETLDCQDTNIPARIHNGAAVVPAALAIGEVTGATGADVIAALVAGYEVGNRLGLATQPAHWYSGFQITGTYNTCGAAAAAGRLLRLDAQEMAAALGAAGFIIPISSADNIFKGHSIKPIHGGQPAASGVSAAYLAKAGYRSGPLEGEPPRFHSALRILGCSKPDLDVATRGLGQLWHLLETGFKPYPVGLFNIGPVEICLVLLAEARIEAEAIKAITIRTYHDAWKFTGQKYTTIDSNYVDAHLSMPFSVAVTLMDGRMTPAQLCRKRLRDPRVHQLAALVNVMQVEEMNALYPHSWPVEVEITLKSGEVRKRRIDDVKWSPRIPPTWPEMTAKFLAMSEPVIGPERARKVVELVAALDDAPSVKPLMQLLA
jgi:2-methylcitrate dehydratase PrpD